MQITVRPENLDRALADVRGVADEQVPFALASSLTSTAKLAQKAVQDALPLRFTIRQTSFMKRNIQVLMANKKDPAPFAEVFDTGGPQGQILRDMGLQESGGSKLPTHGQMIAIPIFRVPSSGFIPKDKTPSAVMASGNGFIRGSVMYLRGAEYKRPRKFVKSFGFTATSGVARAKVTPMYVLVPQARLPKRYGFEDLVRMVVDKNWEAEFSRAFQKAIDTRR